MNAYVFINPQGGFGVSYTEAGEVVDVATGYDDELDAALAARRNVYGFGTVSFGYERALAFGADKLDDVNDGGRY